MNKAIVFEAMRTGYGIDQVGDPMTVGELKRLLEDYGDDTLVILSHDRGYTYGSINSYDMREYKLNEDEEWEEV